MLKQELLAVLKQNKIDISEACDKMHMSRTNFYYHIGKAKIDKEFLKKIEWACNITLITGVKENAQPGENIADKAHSPPTYKVKIDSELSNNYVAESEASYGPENENKGLARYLTPGHVPIPVYDNTDGVQKISALLENEIIKPVVLIMKGHLGCNMIVRHNDSAMDNDFIPPPFTQCQLGIEIVKNFKKFFVDGMAAIIELEDFTITRYVYKVDSNQVLLRSANPESFPDQLIDINSITTMWKIKSITPVSVSKILMY